MMNLIKREKELFVVKMQKKQVNFRLNPRTIARIEELQKVLVEGGFSASKADVVEHAIRQLYGSAIGFENTGDFDEE